MFNRVSYNFLQYRGFHYLTLHKPGINNDGSGPAGCYKIVRSLIIGKSILICGSLNEGVSNSLHNIECMHYRTPLTCLDKGGAEVWLLLLLTPAVTAGARSPVCTGRFTPGTKPCYPWSRRGPAPAPIWTVL
jgi:hypothetical protein